MKWIDEVKKKWTQFQLYRKHCAYAYQMAALYKLAGARSVTFTVTRNKQTGMYDIDLFFTPKRVVHSITIDHTMLSNVLERKGERSDHYS